MTILPTGTQHTITHGDFTAVVTEVGATLRSLTWKGRELLWTFAEDEAPRGFAGAMLAPWPNRIRDGEYAFEGRTLRLPVNEPGFRTALHGLVYAQPFALVRHAGDELTLVGVVYPQIGWEGVLRLELTFSVDADGLACSYHAANVGTTDVPFGFGAHAIFAFPDIDEVSLSLPFDHELRVDERLLPVEVAEVSPEFDFRAPRPLGETVFDTAFTDAPDHWEIRAKGPEHTVTVWADNAMPWVQLYTRPERNGLAIEPMTCGADAFNEGPTHDGRIVLAPGEEAVGSWGVRPS